MTESSGNLKERYFALAGKYIHNQPEKNAHWKEIEENYSSAARHYHTLSHLEYMFGVLEGAWPGINEKENVEWAVFYHDLIYDATRHDNEERSADSAFALLMSYGVEKKKCLAVNNLILATKKHETTGDNDTAYFLDADLSILGAEEARYKKYADGVRKEFNMFTDVAFNAGRIGVLERLLKRDKIFRTEYFYPKFEKQARKNIQNEIESLRTPVRK